MFYIFAGSQVKYKYVYDDTDKSVEYIEYRRIKQAGIDVTNVLSMGVVSEERKPKLRYIGFRECGASLVFNLCEYCIDDINVKLTIQVTAHGFAYCVFDFIEDANHMFYIKCNECIGKCFSASDLGSLERGGETYTLHINIPVQMLDYLLNLWGSHDFKGIMQSFDNLFGSNIHKIVTNLSGKHVKLQSWG